MARPRKCRICGYRFRDNEDICPECFTAREDDISCGQFSESEHTHSQGFNTVSDSDIYDEFREKSFIDEQRGDEAKDPIPSATYGGKQGTPPPTYAQQSYNDPRRTPPPPPPPPFGNYAAPGSREEKLNALRNGYQARSAAQQERLNKNSFYGGAYNNNPNVFYTRRGAQNQKKNNSAVIAVVVIFFLCVFFIPFIMGIVSSVNHSRNTKSTTTSKKYSIDVSISMPDLSLPNISIPDASKIDPFAVTYQQGDKYTLTAQYIYLYPALGPDELDQLYSPEELETVHGIDLPQGIRFCEMIMDLYSDPFIDANYSAPEIKAFGCYINTLDSAGNVVCTSYAVGEYENGTELKNVCFLVPEGYDNYELSLLVKPSSGDAVQKNLEIKYWNIYKQDPEDASSDDTSLSDDASAEETPARTKTTRKTESLVEA